MKVVIFCGGLGTRLREETEFRPKPMVPVGNRPILWHIMKIYAHYGHKDFILCLGYKGEVIKDYFRHYHWNTSDVTLSLGSNPTVTYHTHHAEEDWNVTLLDTGQETQTGGRLRRALPYIDSDTFLATYGDGLANSNINESIAFHKQHGG
ncbi:MAG: sugar phosphate nucleotidyltransferase, partial [Verrucomicrobiota bacterium]